MYVMKTYCSVVGNMEERGLVFFKNLSNGTVSRTTNNDTVHRAVMNRFPSIAMQTIIGSKSN